MTRTAHLVSFVFVFLLTVRHMCLFNLSSCSVATILLLKARWTDELAAYIFSHLGKEKWLLFKRLKTSIPTNAASATNCT